MGVSIEEELIRIVVETMRALYPMAHARYDFNRVRTTCEYWEVCPYALGELLLGPGSREIFEIDEGLSGEVMRERRAKLVTGLGKQKTRWADIEGMEGIQSALVAPLLVGDNCLGTLAIMAAEEYAFFVHADDTEGNVATPQRPAGLDDLGILEIVAQVTTSALTRLRSRDEALRERVGVFQVFAEAAQHTLRNWLLAFEGAVKNHGWAEEVNEVLKDNLAAMRRIVLGYEDFILASDVKPTRISVLTLLSFLAERFKETRPKIDLPKNDLWVSADEERTKAVLCELIRNALDHGKPPVEVWCSTSEHKSTGVTYCDIHIRDHGEGIPSDMQSTIYQPGVTRCQIGHYGMGLYTCRFVATRQGGNLDHVPEAGGGCTSDYS